MINDWYARCIEPDVRAVVHALRNNGINTTASCGHKMWVLCESYDQTHELTTVYNVMYKLGIENYHVTITAVHPTPLNWSKHMRIEIHERWDETLSAAGMLAKEVSDGD